MMKRIFTAAALSAAVSTPVYADAWKDVQDASCLALVVGLENTKLFRPDVVDYMTGLWDASIVQGTFEERDLEIAYWKICKDNPSDGIIVTLGKALQNLQ